ncbi:MAG: Crp/Fnr family transcriptional regulator [Tepidibacter sp.]|jgi:CRP-like cAMP-binding protein|uniref:Crp/Fnr family transcriptional regulator n=1 Tax=Tepidibacter sp. TaxID=2529387 RepID=UPI0025EDC384|nr:Crp/Fnr family transcriptional regulator [Tepidibacter sp.]MCT4507489.1 Crp/Fnr family transcriptional regulator [Tepidibacter sp.]
MFDLEKILKSSVLFKNIGDINLNDMLSNINYKIKSFNKNELIAIEGDSLTSIGILLSGNVEIQKIYPSGKTLTISTLSSGDIFGEVIVFSQKNSYPATLIPITSTKIMFMSKEDILKICTINPDILKNFMSLLSNKILMLNKKVKTLSYQTIREKIASYVLDEYSKQKKLLINIPHSRQEMSEQFAVTRPSLSRELIKMREEELIEFNRNTILIKNLGKLEDFIL